MFQKIISFIVSIIMLVMTSIFPGFVWPGTETVSTGDFLAMVDEAFGFAVPESKEPVFGLDSDDEYYDAVAAAAEYDVLVDYSTIHVFEAVDTEFVATVLVTAANLKTVENTVITNAADFTNAAKVNTAVVYGIISMDTEGKVSNAAMSKTDITASILVAQGLRFVDENVGGVELADGVKTVETYSVADDAIIVDDATDLAVGDVYVLGQSDDVMTGAAYKVEAIEEVDGQKVVTNSAVAIEDVVEKVDYAGSTDVDFSTAMIKDGNGNVISDGYLDAQSISKEDIIDLLKDLADVSFDVAGFNVRARITDNGLNFNISKGIANGVTLSKNYDLTNLTVDAKADVDLKTLNFNEAYLNLAYDLVDTTTISGSYGKTFGDTVVSEGQKIDSDKMIAELVNKYILSEFDSTSIKLFSFVVPLGTTPLTITIDISLRIDVNGRMEIIVTSEEFHGINIINNKVSVVNESKVIDRRVDIYGQFELKLGLGVALGLYGYSLVDVGVLGGIGAYVEATVKYLDADGNPVFDDSTYAVPVDYLVEAAAGIDFDAGEIVVGGHADIYGILQVSVGENSVIAKIGLSKTWTIFDHSNGVFAAIDF